MWWGVSRIAVIGLQRRRSRPSSLSPFMLPSNRFCNQSRRCKRPRRCHVRLDFRRLLSWPCWTSLAVCLNSCWTMMRHHLSRESKCRPPIPRYGGISFSWLGRSSWYRRRRGQRVLQSLLGRHGNGVHRLTCAPCVAQAGVFPKGCRGASVGWQLLLQGWLRVWISFWFVFVFVLNYNFFPGFL